MTDGTPHQYQLLTTSFSYTHAFGRLASFYAALEEGRLLATRCGRCAKAYCSPRFYCLCGSAIDSWITTSGTGILRRVTRSTVGKRPLDLGHSAWFGLIAIEDCDNLLFARLAEREGTYRPGKQVRLCKASKVYQPNDSPTRHPIQQAVFETDSS